MKDEGTEQVDAGFVTAMLSIHEEDGHEWQTSDLVSIWNHQLNAPLGHDLSQTAPDAEETIIRLRNEIREAPVTFGGLFRHPHPPFELLHLVKMFAKKQGTRKDALLPREICSALYYLSIHLARKHHKARISELDEDAIEKGVQWVLDQDWIDRETRELL